MAESIQIAGVATIKVGTGSSSALEILTAGGLRNGSEIVFDSYKLPIHTDDRGGDEGPPSEIQFLGETARITMLMPRWDAAIEAKLWQRIKGNVTPGTPSAAGILMFANSFRLLVLTATRPYNFPSVVFDEPHEINVGTKHSILKLTATAHMGSASFGTTGVLWNTTTSG